jgi:hypothetical protein
MASPSEVGVAYDGHRRTAWIEDNTTICVKHHQASRVWKHACPAPVYVGVIAVSQDFVVVQTMGGVQLVYYTLAVVVRTDIWVHGDVGAKIFGRWDPGVPSILIMWVNSRRFSGLCVVPHVGIDNVHCICPLFYEVGGGGCPLNEETLEYHIVAPSITNTAMVEPPPHVTQSRQYGKDVEPYHAIDCCWRENATTMSGILLTPAGVTSFSVAYDERLGLTNVAPTAYQPIVLLMNTDFIAIAGATTFAVQSEGAVETICVANHQGGWVVDFEEGQPIASVHRFFYVSPDTKWKVSFHGTSIVATSGLNTETIRDVSKF